MPLPSRTWLTALAWAHQLPELLASVSPEEAHRMASQLIASVHVAATQKSFEDVAATQLARCELPLTLSYQFPDVEDFQQLLKVTRRRLEESMTSLCDGEGMFHAQNLPWMPAAVASWTRCLLLMDKAGWRISEDARTEYEMERPQCVADVAPDGRFPFAWASATALRIEEFLDAAVAVADDPEDRALSRTGSPWKTNR